MKLASFVAFSLLAASAAAQCGPYYYDDPNPTGGRNAFPWGSHGVRYQMIIPQAVLGAAPFAITGLRVPGDTAQTAAFTITYNRIEIRLGHTTQAAPIADWNTNNPSPTVCHDGPAVLVLNANTWTDLNLTTPFAYNGTSNVCLEVICWDVQGQPLPSNFLFPANSAAISRAFRFNWVSDQTQIPLTGTGGGKIGILCGPLTCNTAANRTFYGVGCGNHASGPMGVGNTHVIPRLGTPGMLAGRWGPANSAGVYMVGGGQANIDLGFLGAPGCTASVNLAGIVNIPCTFDGLGDATRPNFDIPNQLSLCGVRLNVQIVAFWPGLNPLQIGTSNAIELLLGS